MSHKCHCATCFYSRNVPVFKHLTISSLIPYTLLSGGFMIAVRVPVPLPMRPTRHCNKVGFHGCGARLRSNGVCPNCHHEPFPWDVTYRYYCPACTQEVGFHSGQCAWCGQHVFPPDST